MNKSNVIKSKHSVNNKYVKGRIEIPKGRNTAQSDKKAAIVVSLSMNSSTVFA
jgi:hypothetical protein